MTAKTDKDDDAIKVEADKLEANAKDVADAAKAADEKSKADAKELADLKAQLEAANKALEAKDKAELSAAKTLSQAAAPKADGNAIQCLLRRKGGTEITFGHNGAKQVTYHFKPISGAEDAPHVCNVEDDEHFARFLAIPEAYRRYRAGENLVDTIPVNHNPDETDPFKNRFDDILSIDFENGENELVTKWAKDILNLTISQGAQVRKKAAALDVDVKKGESLTEVFRNIGKAMQAEERLASEQASKDK